MARIISAFLSLTLLIGPMGPAAFALGNVVKQTPVAPLRSAAFRTPHGSAINFRTPLSNAQRFIGFHGLELTAPANTAATFIGSHGLELKPNIPSAVVEPAIEPAVQQQLTQTVQGIQKGEVAATTAQLYDRQQAQEDRSSIVAGAAVSIAPNFLNKGVTDKAPVRASRIEGLVARQRSPAGFLSRATTWVKANPMLAMTAVAVPAAAAALIFGVPTAAVASVSPVLIGVPVLGSIFSSWRDFSFGRAMVFGFNWPTWGQKGRVDEAARRSASSATAMALDREFRAKGGQIVVDSDSRANYQSAAVGTFASPAIALTENTIGTSDGTSAPWEFMQAVIARSQVFSNDWYKTIPPSAEFIAAAYMNMLRVFVDLTNSTSRPQGWAADKDRRDLRDGQYIAWSWYKELLTAAKSGKHLNETEFFVWARDYVSKMLSDNPSYQYSLWEMHDRKHFRPGSPLNGTPIPSHIPAIDRPTFDRVAAQMFGTDGKGTDGQGKTSDQNIYGWILNWLRSRREI